MNSDHIKIHILGVPGFLILGLGINSIFAGEAPRIHPVLENQSVGMALLAIGGVISLLAFKKAVHVFKNR